jgi:hypothetical protein
MPTKPLTAYQLVEAVAALKETNGDYAKAGRLLGISRNAMKNRIAHAKEHGLLEERKPTSDGPKTHCMIPDVQAKPGVPLDHLAWAGNYIAEKQPDVVIVIGDFADMPSLSSYDKGKRSAENKRYKADIEAAHKAMELLMTPIVKEQDTTQGW